MLISIIIPCYNRAHLIVETLRSITNQSYHNWECLIIDDGSTDDSTTLVNDYSKKDLRFKLYHRPGSFSKGANTCRNIGLEKAQGNYVMFFDSDDLMTSDHLEYKLEAIRNDYDMVIARTKEFNHPDTTKTFISSLERYHFNRYEASLKNYALQKINWLTPDSLIKRSVAQKVSFDESLHRGQEYNYYCKLLLQEPKITVIDDYLTLRRMHPDSIKSSLTVAEDVSKRAISKLVTLKEISNFITDELVIEMLTQIVLDLTTHRCKLPFKYSLLTITYLNKYRSFKASAWFLLSCLTKTIFGKNHFFRLKLKKALQNS